MAWLEDPADDPIPLQQGWCPSSSKLVALKADISLPWGVCQGMVLLDQVVSTGRWEHGPDSGPPLLLLLEETWGPALLLPNWVALSKAGHFSDRLGNCA